jgi:hypothetical protein
MERRQLWRMGIILLASLASGCTILPPVGEVGELGNGGFTYKCVGDGTDLGCANAISANAPIPLAFAVGASVTFTFTPERSESSKDEGTADLAASLMSASPEILVAEGKSFRFLKAGTVALLARTSTGVVVDFLHLKGEEIDHLDVEDDLGNAVEDVQLKPLGSIVLNVTPKGASGATLAGPLHYAWQTSDEAVAKLASTQPLGSIERANRVTLSAGQQDGEALISVTVQERKLDIPVQIGGAP